MDSLPRSLAIDLCGDEPARLPAGNKRASISIVPNKSRPELAEDLARVVEGEIIPRLMMALKSEPGAPSQDYRLGPDLAEQFALYALSSGPDSLLAIIGNLLKQGASLEAIYLDLLGPAARLLGDFWTDDRVSFADVTIALGRLQHIVRELSLHGPQETLPFSSGRSALFAPAPFEQHTFGLVIIEEFFRRSGWRTWAELSGSPDEVLAAVKAHHFDLFGMTCSTDDRLDQIAPMVMSVRQASRNRDITVMVGGRLFVERPELVAQVGADKMATDARQAVLVADEAVRQLARR